MLERLRVGVHAGHARRPPRELARSRSPRRRPCPPRRGRRRARRSSGTRRGGAGTSSSPRGRPAAFARRSATAAERPPAGSAACTRLLPARGGEYSPAPPMATATADNIRDVNIRYHDLAAADYDAKWGIDYGEAGQAQVIGKLAKALGREPERYERSLEIGAGTGYFTLNLLRAGVIARGGRDRHLARHARDAVRLGRAAGPRRADDPVRGRQAAVRRRVVRPRLRARGPPPPAGPRRGVRGVPARPQAGRHARLLRRAVALRRSDLAGAEARRGGARAGVAAADARHEARLLRRARRPRGGQARVARGRARVHAADARLAGTRRRASGTFASPARS